MKTALVHDWLYSVTGAEKVLEVIYSLFPSRVHTLIANHSNLSMFPIPRNMISTSFIQKLPLAKTCYPYYLGLFPLAIESFDLQEADLIISSSSCMAKGILSHADQLHICYCHTPMRYAWDLYFDYLGGLSTAKQLLTKLLLHRLRHLDVLHSARVDYFVANSQTVAKRIAKTYKREATVIYPPVDCSFFEMDLGIRKEHIYVTAGRLIPYKKIDLIIQAFIKTPQRSLIIIGDGPEMKRLKKMSSQNISFLGAITDEEMRVWLQKAKAFIYMAHEDFGILPVEAQAAGTPVIAYGKGGCKETVLEGITGMLFPDQTPESLLEALELFEKNEDKWDSSKIRSHARLFSTQVFKQKFHAFVTEKYEQFKKDENIHPSRRARE